MEQNWSARLRQGDEDALCEIIRQRTGYVSTILRNFSRSTLPPEDLEELSADVFLRLWRSRDKLKDGADLSPYLAAIARNCMKNYTCCMISTTLTIHTTQWMQRGVCVKIEWRFCHVPDRPDVKRTGL